MNTLIERLAYAFIGMLLTGFVVLLITALRSRKPSAQKTCGDMMLPGPSPQCTRHEGHYGLHSVNCGGRDYWWVKAEP